MYTRLHAFLRLFLWIACLSTLLIQCKKPDEQPITPTPTQEPIKPGVNVGFGAQLLPKADYEKVPLLPDPLAGARRSSLSKDPNLPTSYDLSINTPPVGNQGNQSSCVAWAVAYAARSYFNKVAKNVSYKATNGSLNTESLFSPAFLYNQVKLGGCDGGSQVSTTLELLKTTGVCTLKEMAYVDNDCSTQPTADQRQKAAAYKIRDWGRINISATVIRKYLYFDSPVIIAARVDDNFVQLKQKDSSGEYSWQEYNPSTVVGGHAMVIVGYDDTRKAFKVQNSWTDRWANKGFIWLSYDILPKAVFEAYVMIADGNPNAKQPSIKTESAGPVINRQVQLKGTITDLGDIPVLRYGFCTSSILVLPTDQTVVQNQTVTSLPYSFSQNVPITTERLYYRAFAETTNGIVYGDTASVITKTTAVSATGGVLVYQTDALTYAYDAGSGKPVWNYRMPSSYASGLGSITNNVYACASRLLLYGINAQTGLQKWTYDPGGQIPYPHSAAVVTSKDVAFLVAGKTIHALDLATGAKKWTYTPTTPGTISGIAVAENYLVVYGLNDAVLVLDASTSALKQTIPVGTEASPVIANGVLYMLGYNSIEAYSLATGVQKWVYRGGNLGTPTVYNNTLYINQLSPQRLLAIDAGTGIQKWAYTSTEGWIDALSVDNGIVCIKQNTASGFDASIIALDAVAGGIKWSKKYVYTRSSYPVDAPLVARSTVYISSFDNVLGRNILTAHEADTGKTLWEITDQGASQRGAYCVQDPDGKTHHFPQSGTQQ